MDKIRLPHSDDKKEKSVTAAFPARIEEISEEFELDRVDFETLMEEIRAS